MHKIVMIANIFLCAVTAGMAAYHPLHAEDPATTLIPIEAFASLPTFDQAKLSPHGDKIAYATLLRGQNTVIYQSLNGTERHLLPTVEDADILQFKWANNDTVILEVGYEQARGMQRSIFLTRYFAFTPGLKEMLWLGSPLERRRNKIGGGWMHMDAVSQIERLVSLLPEDPDHVLMELDFETGNYPEVYRVNLKSGLKRAVEQRRPPVNNWYVDADHTVRLGTGFRVTGRLKEERAVLWKNPAGEWEDLTQTDWISNYDILGFTEDPSVLYVKGTSPQGTDGLFLLNVTSGDILKDVYSNPRVDVDRVYYHPVSGLIAGAEYRENVRRRHYLDPDLAKIQRSLEKVFSGKRVWIADQARERDRYLVLVSAPASPGIYYVYDRDTKSVTPLRARNRLIAKALHDAPKALKAPEAVLIPVRGGGSISGYLTLPAKTEALLLPVIIMPHGGPKSRSDAEWNYWAQFYANRGYAVLEPNFRGSSGYGFAFEQAGKQQWGGLMQDDVTDATRWLIKEGIADPGRICIVGASYGGYAALMGPIKEPGLYRCAVSVNGITDLPRLRAGDKRFVGGTTWTRDMGLAGQDDKTISPYHRADELKVPVLLIAAVDDARVPYRMSRALHSRLKKRRDDAEYVEIESGGHSMVTSESRLIMLRETERFLAKHLGRHD